MPFKIVFFEPSKLVSAKTLIPAVKVGGILNSP